MKTIVVKTQAELNALPVSFSERTIIEIRSPEGEWLYVRNAWGNSSVVARENSSVVARENSSVEARENSSVEAWENSSVVAWENSSVEAWGNSSVEARENSSVVARENSSVEARENSSVEARENVAIHVHSTSSAVDLFGFAVAIVVAVGSKLIKAKSKTATIVRPPEPEWTVDGWLDREGVKATRGKVILFKRLSHDFKTQEGERNETLWKIGTTLSHHAWNPSSGECGEGKFHACSRPYFCDQFRAKKGDVYVAIETAKKDLHTWPNPDYPHKIAFRKGTVLHVCNRFGKEAK